MDNELRQYYEKLILEKYFLLNPDEFDTWMYYSFKVSSAENPDGMFYNMQEMKDFCNYPSDDDVA
jgi:hypothetical protein